jgi:hypothetical protein
MGGLGRGGMGRQGRNKGMDGEVDRDGKMWWWSIN